MIDELQITGKNIAMMVATVIEQDIGPYRLLSQVDHYESGTYDEAYYRRMNHLLHLFQEETGAAFIYTEKRVDIDTFAYILDGTSPTSHDFSPIGSSGKMGAVEYTVFDTKRPKASDLVEDVVWGPFITAYAPIVDDRDDTVVGLVGVDFSAEMVQEMSSQLNWIIGLSFSFLSLVVSLVVYFIFKIIYQASYTDYLTKLSSRKYHNKRLKALIRNGSGVDHAFCVLMLDIDWFKEVNDTMGHAFGDSVLIQVAQTIREHARAIDVCSRYGGDEFAVLLPDATVKQAYHVARRILDGVGHLHMMEGKPMSVSIGLVAWEFGMDEHVTMEFADKALYTARAHGKGRIVVYEEPNPKV
ncbi:MAG: GGDEF domain-containing protein [Sphaerochaetaceae bacterium]